MTIPTNSAVLLLAHGTPDTLGEMAAYLDKVTNDRGVPQHVVEELQHRYAEIGLRDTPGTEPPPLTRWTMRQAALLQEKIGAKVYAAMRNWHPFIADVMRQMRADGITHCVAICLAPQNSRTSVGLYQKAVMASAENITVDFVPAWASHPLLIKAFAERLTPALAAAREAAVAANSPKGPTVLFTAHSVPERTVLATADTLADPYADEAKNTAALVAAAANVHADEWRFAFQSQGMSGGPWIGPTVEDTLAKIRAEGYTHVLIQPIGFLCDHVEILYDIDIAFAQTAASLGLTLSRARSLNASPLLADALTDIARNAFAHSAAHAV
jgi:ferrochelatase